MENTKIVNLVTKPDSKNSYFFKSKLSDFADILDTVDRAGMSIGRSNLSLEVLMSLADMLIRITEKDARNDIPTVPSYEEYKAQVEKYNVACEVKTSSAVERRKAE